MRKKKNDYTGIRGCSSEAIKLHFSNHYGEKEISKELEINNKKSKLLNSKSSMLFSRFLKQNDAFQDSTNLLDSWQLSDFQNSHDSKS